MEMTENVSRIKKKLNSTDGATLILALVFFVICAALGAAVLTAATVTSGRHASSKEGITVEEADQEHYSLESAATLIESQITNQYVFLYFDGSNCYAHNAYWKDKKYVSSAAGGSMKQSESEIWSSITSAGDDIANSLLDSAAAVVWGKAGIFYDWKSSSGGAYQRDATVSLKEVSDQIADVTCTFTIDSSYNLTAELSAGDVSGTGNSIKMFFSSSVKTYDKVKKNGTVENGERIRVSWGEPQRS